MYAHVSSFILALSNTNYSIIFKKNEGTIVKKVHLRAFSLVTAGDVP